MGWIALSCVYFVTSVVLYLLVRKLGLDKVSSRVINLACFGIPFFICLGISLSSGDQLAITGAPLAATMFAGMGCAYVGTFTLFKSLEAAPNPGYPLIISKSYVLYTVFLSALIFGSSLSWLKFVGVLAILGFAFLVVIDHANDRDSSRAIWLPLALTSFACFGTLSLLVKYVLDSGVPVFVFLMYLYAIASLLIIIEILITRPSLRIKTSQWIILLAIGALSALFDLSGFQAIKLAPNVGYVNAVNVASISVVTLLSAIIFKDHLSVRKFIGVLGVVAGMTVLFI